MMEGMLVCFSSAESRVQGVVWAWGVGIYPYPMRGVAGTVPPEVPAT